MKTPKSKLPQDAVTHFDAERARALYEQRLIDVASRIYAARNMSNDVGETNDEIATAVGDAAQLIGECRGAASKVVFEQLP